MLTIEIESRGYFSLDINEETSLDEYGNDATDLLAALKEEDIGKLTLYLDAYVSNMSIDYDFTAYNYDNEDEEPFRLYGTLW